MPARVPRSARSEVQSRATLVRERASAPSPVSSLVASADRVRPPGNVEVIGGSGKWTGATGTGELKQKWTEGSRGSYEYTFDIATPE